MSELNMEVIRESARLRWFKSRKRSFSFQEWVDWSVPFWLVIVAFVLFFLSAPHTAEMFNKITPVAGYLAPFGVEFALLYTSFYKRKAARAANRVPGELRLLEYLMFVLALLTNGAGAMYAVASSENMRNLSAQDILNGLATMSITAQVLLVLVPISAIIIPLGTLVAGEGLATLVFERRETGNELEMEWQQVEQREVFRATYSTLVRSGIKPIEAKRTAGSATSNFYASLSIHKHQIEGLVEAISEPSAVSAADMRRTPRRTAPRTPAAPIVVRRSKADVMRYLDDNPDKAELSVRTLAELSGASKTTAHEALSEWKQKRGKE